MKKLYYLIPFNLIVLIISFYFSSCEEDEPALAEVNTVAIGSVSATSATSGGNVIKDAGSPCN